MLFIISTYFVKLFPGPLCQVLWRKELKVIFQYIRQKTNTLNTWEWNCPFIHFIHGSIENGEIFVTDEIGNTLLFKYTKERAYSRIFSSYISKVPRGMYLVCRRYSMKMWQEVQGMAVLGQAVVVGRMQSHAEDLLELAQDWDQISRYVRGRSRGRWLLAQAGQLAAGWFGGCSTCPALGPGESWDPKSPAKWRLSWVLTEWEFQILNQSKSTSSDVQGTGFRGELVKGAKGSHHAGSMCSYWEEAGSDSVYKTEMPDLCFVVLSGKLSVIILSCIELHFKFMTSSLHISREWILCS